MKINMGFQDKKGQKVHPNFATNIAMESHCHAFFAPDLFESPWKLDTRYIETLSGWISLRILSFCPDPCTQMPKGRKACPYHKGLW